MPRKKRELDTVDALHVSEMLESRGWQLYRQRIEQTLEVKLNELVRPNDAVPTAHIRGYIEALRVALRVPENIIAEGGKNANSSVTEGELI